MNDPIVLYYEDQINYYSDRLKKNEKSLKDKERVGLPITELNKIVLQDDKENVKRYQDKLKKYLDQNK